MGWGFGPACVKWDGDEKTFKVNNAVKVTVSVNEGTFHCDWEQSWRDRVSFFNSSELQELFKTLGGMVVGTGKGKG